MIMALIVFPIRMIRLVAMALMTLLSWLWYSAQEAGAVVYGIYLSQDEHLHIWGDSNDNTLTIGVSNGAVVAFDLADSTSVLIRDEFDETVAPGSVETISVDGYDGDDVIDLGPLYNTYGFSAIRRVSASGGEGNDTIYGVNGDQNVWNFLYGGAGADCVVAGANAINDLYHADLGTCVGQDYGADTLVLRGNDEYYMNDNDGDDEIDESGDLYEPVRILSC
jgi:hypothetical protein